MRSSPAAGATTRAAVWTPRSAMRPERCASKSSAAAGRSVACNALEGTVRTFRTFAASRKFEKFEPSPVELARGHAAQERAHAIGVERLAQDRSTDARQEALHALARSAAGHEGDAPLELRALFADALE